MISGWIVDGVGEVFWADTGDVVDRSAQRARNETDARVRCLIRGDMIDLFPDPMAGLATAIPLTALAHRPPCRAVVALSPAPRSALVASRRRGRTLQQRRVRPERLPLGPEDALVRLRPYVSLVLVLE